MKTLFNWTLLASALAAASPVLAQATFFEGERFEGRSVAVQNVVRSFERSGFRDGLSSATVLDERWEVCDERRMRGKCMVLRQGRYPSPQAMGLNSRVESARLVPVNERIHSSRLAPEPVAIYDSRRRRNERLYEAPITSVRAVMGAPEQRCWMEREAVAPTRQGNNVGGAIAGALIGGILGHQVGGGSGKDIATVGGVVAGAAIGSQVGRDRNGPTGETRDVQRCSNTAASNEPHHWEVTYTYRGQDHLIQTAVPPQGNTITVNRKGEPRT